MEPVVYGLVALSPASVTFVVTKDSKPLVRQVLQRVRRSGVALDGNAVESVVVEPDDPASIRRELEEHFAYEHERRGDLLFGGGTTVMNVVAASVWSVQHSDSGSRSDPEYRQWYLPARGSQLLSPSGDRIDLRAAFPGIDQLVKSAAPEQSRWEPEADEWLGRATPPGVGPAQPWSADSHVGAVTELVVALLSRVEDKSWKNNDWLKGRLGTAFDESDWTPDPQQVSKDRLAGWRRGKALELVTFALVARRVHQLTSAPRARSGSVAPEVLRNLSVNRLKKGRKPATVTELDVVVRSGPRFTLFSCGVEGGVRQAPLVKKLAEAERRSKQFGGSEARSVLVWWRSPDRGRPARNNKPAQRVGWNIPKDMSSAASESRNMMDNAGINALGNHVAVALGEFFARRDKESIRETVEDPGRVPKRVREIIEGSVFP